METQLVIPAGLPLCALSVRVPKLPRPLLSFSPGFLVTRADLCVLGQGVVSLSLGFPTRNVEIIRPASQGRCEYEMRSDFAVSSMGLTQGRCPVTKPTVPGMARFILAVALNASPDLNLGAPGTKDYFYLHFV